ncbi:MAG TPA: aspartate aminotransferase family protein [Steroidobacteraceae bacterium]
MMEHVKAIAKGHADYINPVFVQILETGRYGRIFTGAEGRYLWDSHGRKYLDMVGAFGAATIGHNHPSVVGALREYLGAAQCHICHFGLIESAVQLAKRLAELVPPPLKMSLFSSSGAEAVDAALKLARAVTGRKKFVYCDGGYHGTNLGTLSVMGVERMRKPFEPLLTDCTAIPYGDIGALEAAVSGSDCAAFIVEPVQAEAGVVVPPEGYLREALRLCRPRGTLLILDEVQTGLGRTGRMFGMQWDEVVPDILLLAKGLSGGIAPIGVTLTSESLFRAAYGRPETHDLHGSTFGGNGFSAVAALASLAVIDTERLVENSERVGDYCLQGLRHRLSGHPLVKDIRGRGLLIAIELSDGKSVPKRSPSAAQRMSPAGIYCQWLCLRMLERGIVCQTASLHWNILKLTPPLGVKEPEIDAFLNVLESVMGEDDDIGRVCRKFAKRLSASDMHTW